MPGPVKRASAFGAGYQSLTKIFIIDCVENAVAVNFQYPVNLIKALIQVGVAEMLNQIGGKARIERAVLELKIRAVTLLDFLGLRGNIHSDDAFAVLELSPEASHQSAASGTDINGVFPYITSAK